MKSFLTFKILMLVLIALSISSCKKEDNNPVQNTMTLNGSPFAVSTASLMGVSIGGEGHVTITLAGVTGATSNILTIDIEYFVNQPIEGNYAFPQTGTARFLDDWLTNYAQFNGASSNTVNLEAGSVDIADNGNNNYTITMDMTMLDGKVFKGTYTGNFVVQFNNGK